MEKKQQPKVAIIGSGIAGLGFAYIAQHNNWDITLYEKNHYFGGHSNTIDLEINQKTIPVDTGFLVHNKITYPNLIQLFEQLKVEIVDSEMSLSVGLDESDFEWGGNNLDTLFAKRTNIFNFKFYRFIKEILKFNKSANEYLNWAKADTTRTLEDLLNQFKFHQEIKEWYIIPMAAAIWSTPANKILEFPAHTFLTFSLNHHLLQVNDRPTWRTIKNGSRNYVKKITDLIEKKYLNAEVKSVEYKNNLVYITCNDEIKEFDKVIFANHPDEVLNLINNTDVQIKDVLSNFVYEKNTAYVHRDTTFLPKRKKLWSAWNYIHSKKHKKVTVSYYINKLQPLETTEPVIVTLNPHRPVDPLKTWKVIEYAHPLFDTKAINAQAKIKDIQGIQNMYFAGAWTRYGFHEDGLRSAVVLAKQLNLKIPWNEVI